MRQKWLDNLSDEARNKLSAAEKKFSLRYNLLVGLTDLTPTDAPTPAAAPAAPDAPSPARPPGAARPSRRRPQTRTTSRRRRAGAWKSWKPMRPATLPTAPRRKTPDPMHGPGPMHEAAWAVILVGLLFTGIRLAVPLLLAALGETLAEKAGVINVGMEGMMLAGALAGFAAAFATHSPWAGAGAAVLAGAALAALFAALTVGLGADQVVVGTAVNILALGLTGVFFRALPQLNGATAAAFAPLTLPFLRPTHGAAPACPPSSCPPCSSRTRWAGWPGPWSPWSG